VLYLEPAGPTATKARYIVEIDPKGWLPGVVRTRARHR
jgi:hypothetical protein